MTPMPNGFKKIICKDAKGTFTVPARNISLKNSSLIYDGTEGSVTIRNDGDALYIEMVRKE